MDNSKPRIDATDDKAERPSRGVREDGQDRRRGGLPTWAEMMHHIGPFGPPPPFMYGPSEFGPPFMHRPMHYPMDGQLPPMNGPSHFGPSYSPWGGARLQTMPGPSPFGPMSWSWGSRHRGADDATDTESDDQHAGKDSADNVGKEAHGKQDGAGDDKPDPYRRSCPHGDRCRRHEMNGSPRHGRRRNPYGIHRRCHRGFGAHLHGPPRSTGPSECHQPGYPMDWGEFPFPPHPFFSPSPWDSAGDNSGHPENDSQKQDVGAQSREAPSRFSSLVSRQRRMGRPCVRPGQTYCDRRDKLLSMLWKRDTLKYKLQRIESSIERMQPSDDETQETTTMTTEVDASRQQASSMDVTPQEGATVDVDANNEWEIIADNDKFKRK